MEASQKIAKLQGALKKERLDLKDARKKIRATARSQIAAAEEAARNDQEFLVHAMKGTKELEAAASLKIAELEEAARDDEARMLHSPT